MKGDGNKDAFFTRSMPQMPLNLTPEQLQTLEMRTLAHAPRRIKYTNNSLRKKSAKGQSRLHFIRYRVTDIRPDGKLQLVRLMTGETPDQPFAQTGVRAQILEWEKSTGGTGSLPDPAVRNFRYAAADKCGRFSRA